MISLKILVTGESIMNNNIRDKSNRNLDDLLVEAMISEIKAKEFYENVYQCLKSDGIMVTQSESPRFNESVFKGIQTCYQQIFGRNNVQPYLAYIPTYPSGLWGSQ